MHSDVASKLHFHYMETTGTIGLWYDGKRIARCKEITQGSRQFFKVGNYFVKAEYLYENWVGQCGDEIYIHGKILPKDKQYFTRLLACSDVTNVGIQWTMFHWYNLSKKQPSAELYDACRSQVDRLCDKYGINDVAPYFGVNWFIHNSKPLIVDCGIRR